MTMRMIECDNLLKIYKVADLEVVALQGLDLQVELGELVAIVGASGSGKSTLLNILGGLDTPSAGEVRVGGIDLLNMSAADRTRYRRSMVGFVWQQTTRNLLPYLSALDNVRLPMTVTNRSKRDTRRRAEELLARVGLANRADHYPRQLSGGEQQRVAIAVSLANEPHVLFADEPTGELDHTTAAEVFEVLRQVNQDSKTTVVVVTHDPQISEHVNRVVAIRDGRTSSEVRRRAGRTEHGEHAVVAEEYVVLDRVGRLQLPHDYMRALELQDRVKLTLDSDHIGVWRENPSDPETEETR